MTGFLLCAIGRHDWTEFGDCRRDPLHVQMRRGEMLVGVGHLLRGTDWTNGPWDRVMRRKSEAKRAAGLRLQGDMAALGRDVSLELCMDMASRPDDAAALLDLARERSALGAEPDQETLG